MAFRVVDTPIRAWNACATSNVGLIRIYSKCGSHCQYLRLEHGNFIAARFREP